MTIDELIRKLRDHKKAGLAGSTQVVGFDPYALTNTGTETNIIPILSTKIVTIKMNENGVAGKVVDGRGKPRGTERAVKLL